MGNFKRYPLDNLNCGKDLMKLHELFADPERWTQEAFARDRYGFPCCYESADAVCFCAVGGLHAYYGEGEDFHAALVRLANHLNAPGWAGYEVWSAAIARDIIYDSNDSNDGYETVLAAARRADV